MKQKLLPYIQSEIKIGKKFLCILIDPDKMNDHQLLPAIDRIEHLQADFIFVGGSVVKKGATDMLVKKIKKLTQIPVVLFPGDYEQITADADAILFLSLLSGRNPKYLIEQQIAAVPFLKNTSLEIIPTGYILIDGGILSSVLKVSETKPISQNNINLIVDTAIAGMYKGKKLIYLEAGSGAKKSVSNKIIKEVKKNINIPLIVGGGIKTKEQIKKAFNSGADLVVIGTAFENKTI
ncbi:MAG: geranylgeranylglyceryl/heptaprenylglyceryl phosphate synthase [Lutibacter sp.]